MSQITDPVAKRNAFNAVINSWSGNNPQTVAEYASQLDSSDEKKFALTVALRNWAGYDALQAANWICQHAPSPELDAGTAGVAIEPENLHQPTIAAQWAESITNPELRSNTLMTVLREWALRDPVAAMNYLKSTNGLRPNDRAELLADFS